MRFLAQSRNLSQFLASSAQFLPGLVPRFTQCAQRRLYLRGLGLLVLQECSKGVAFLLNVRLLSIRSASPCFCVATTGTPSSSAAHLPALGIAKQALNFLDPRRKDLPLLIAYGQLPLYALSRLLAKTLHSLAHLVRVSPAARITPSLVSACRLALLRDYLPGNDHAHNYCCYKRHQCSFALHRLLLSVKIRQVYVLGESGNPGGLNLSHGFGC